MWCGVVWGANERTCFAAVHSCCLLCTLFTHPETQPCGLNLLCDCVIVQPCCRMRAIQAVPDLVDVAVAAWHQAQQQPQGTRVQQLQQVQSQGHGATASSRDPTAQDALPAVKDTGYALLQLCYVLKDSACGLMPSRMDTQGASFSTGAQRLPLPFPGCAVQSGHGGGGGIGDVVEGMVQLQACVPGLFVEHVWDLLLMLPGASGKVSARSITTAHSSWRISVLPCRYCRNPCTKQSVYMCWSEKACSLQS